MCALNTADHGGLTLLDSDCMHAALTSKPCKGVLLGHHVQGEEQGGMSISLPRVNSAELLLFPETAEGHVSKVILLDRLSCSVCKECLN